ncbi:type IV pilus secretin PilQ [Hylemonella gracilis]|uniref:type IV pilus secretin PilQ n=1 Tax=Hylemonella gracilis TaxID=80880 RepID=UPI001F6015E9|nr:type IV pilus secretin PilQ [Hylemonella gracilis]
MKPSLSVTLPVLVRWVCLALAGLCAGGLPSARAMALEDAQARTVAPGAQGTEPVGRARILSVTGAVEQGLEVLRIGLSMPLVSAPAGLLTHAPARIAFDLDNVDPAFEHATVDIQQGNLRSVQLVPMGQHTRVLLNLRLATGYRTELQADALRIVLSPLPGTRVETVTPEAAGADAEVTWAGARPVEAIQALDVRRGADGSGRVIVALPSSEVGADIRASGGALTVEFPGTRLPERLQGERDVSGLGTPLRSVVAQQVGQRVRLRIEADGSWEYSAHQNDTQFVVEFVPRTASPDEPVARPRYSGQKLTLNFQNIDIRALLQVIADFSGFNVVTSDKVVGNVTLRLRDVPWDQALDILLQTKGLDQRRQGNVLWIAPRQEIVARERQESEARAAQEVLEPLRTRSFQLNYAKAADVAQQLGGAGAVGGSAGAVVAARILGPRGSAIAEARTNQLFVTDIATRLEAVQALIVKIDVPVRQVLIEARIVEASDTFSRSLGARLGGAGGRAPGGGSGLGLGGSYSATAAGAGGGSFVNLPSPGLGGQPAGVFAVSIFGESAARFLNLEISALEADGKGKVVSSPRVVTADKVKALIEQGTELPYQVSTSSGATSISFRKANLMLEVTPQITPEGNVILEVDVSKDSVGQDTQAGFAIDTKHVKTQVLVENGGTVVIGGIYTQEERETVTKIPFLGDLPGLGALFRAREMRSEKREMLVFITPKALTDSLLSTR